MKKYLLLLLLLVSACQAAPPAISPTAATPTRFPPTPIPASRTPTQTPAPTRTSTPPPRYFQEDFEVVPAYWSTLYASGQAQRAEILNRNGNLWFELYDQNTWVYAVFGAHTYQAVHIETRVENRASDLNYMGLVCYYDEQRGWIEFNLSGDGTYSLLFGQWLMEGIARYTPILNEPSPYIFPGKTVNEMGLDCFENTVQLYMNGKLVRKMDVSRFDLPGGKVGLAVASFDELPVIVAFDWVKIEEP